MKTRWNSPSCSQCLKHADSYTTVWYDHAHTGAWKHTNERATVPVRFFPERKKKAANDRTKQSNENEERAERIFNSNIKEEEEEEHKKRKREMQVLLS
ncbi:hypothetical protein STCU_11843 [Strigomonas culicis]|uniref:Uncharacterized protein n=1 Tax=Strigomonas culicis TaxID=28005 RepID=S9UYR7_9TRYP|nr:hypothetical protein STCU_11843 [Strigomonas culicis]|eukprot:EPY15670.1 hypothetical protein STCU_11843 [Strigomonas culicis]